MAANTTPLGRRALAKFGLATAAIPLLPRVKVAQAADATASAMTALVAAAKQEGTLNVISLERTWANNDGLLNCFVKKYGLKVNESSPEATSAQEIQAVRSLKGQQREVDGVDIGVSFAVLGEKDNLFTPYQVSTWDSIPEGMKHPGGAWVGDYFGVITFASNMTVVKNPPRTWNDLKKPEYKGMIALDGQPLGAAAAFAAVFAASLANGGDFDNIQPGVEFFAELAKLGNYVPAAAIGPAMLVNGQTPIVINWDFLSLAYRDSAKSMVELLVVVPEGAKPYGSFYCQAIPAAAPHPNAAKLWQEYIYSDEGQLQYLAGYAHPARYADLVARKLVPAELAAKLPPAAPYQEVTFASLEQIAKAQKELAILWPKLVHV